MIQFGTGGWRAIIGEDFTKANLQLLTRALAIKIKDEGVEEKGFVIGYDRRFLSSLSAQWAAEVLAAEGIPTYLIHQEAPTPLIMYTVKSMECAYGMAITASHNPAAYNGVKVFTAGGRDADEQTTLEIEQYIADLSGQAVPFLEYPLGIEKRLIQEINPFNAYIDSILSSVNAEAIRTAELRVVLDPMYGVSKTSLQTILMTARCHVDVIHERHDTLFGGRLPAPNASTLVALTEYVKSHHCDIGIATDGDADRIGVIDDNGEFLHPNKILVLLYYYLMKYRGIQGAAVRNIATTHLLDKVAEAFGEKCYEVPVGFKYISSKMIESYALIGGESSGGLTVRGHIQGKDGIYAAALLVEMIAVTGKKLSEIYADIEAEYGTFHMIESDSSFTLQRKEEIMHLLFEEQALPDFPIEIENVSYLDGCKVYFKNGGWICARFSGTEALIRIFCEMPDEKQAESILRIFSTFLGL